MGAALAFLEAAPFQAPQHAWKCVKQLLRAESEVSLSV
jgi:hypothetical protein